MPNKHRKESQEKDEDIDAKAAGSESQITLAKGGMSPLADRKDPKDWEKSVDAEPATEKPEASRGGAKSTPAEPVGGWVDGSTGRGKILVPEKAASGALANRPTDEHSPMRVLKAKEAGAAAMGSGTLGGRILSRKEKEDEKRAAEARANERQEEDRDQQGALQDEEEDEADEESDEKF